MCNFSPFTHMYTCTLILYVHALFTFYTVNNGEPGMCILLVLLLFQRYPLEIPLCLHTFPFILSQWNQMNELDGGNLCRFCTSGENDFFYDFFIKESSCACCTHSLHMSYKMYAFLFAHHASHCEQKWMSGWTSVWVFWERKKMNALFIGVWECERGARIKENLLRWFSQACMSISTIRLKKSVSFAYAVCL